MRKTIVHQLTVTRVPRRDIITPSVFTSSQLQHPLFSPQQYRLQAHTLHIIISIRVTNITDRANPNASSNGQSDQSPQALYPRHCNSFGMHRLLSQTWSEQLTAEKNRNSKRNIWIHLYVHYFFSTSGIINCSVTILPFVARHQDIIQQCSQRDMIKWQLISNKLPPFRIFEMLVNRKSLKMCV